MDNERINELICSAGLVPLPLKRLPKLGNGRSTLWLKQEWLPPDGHDPLRSIKRKPACFLFEDHWAKHYVGHNQILMSATSGNFGLETGLLAKAKNAPFLAVVPAAVPEYNLKIIQALGIDVIKTKEQETCPREFTVFFARGYAHEFHHRLVNVEQYYSFLNPLTHCLLTGKEICDELPEADTIVAAVGSCGTVSGIIQYIMATNQKAEVVGVQPAVHQGVPGTHIIKGECRWSPENYSPVLLPGARIETADQTDSYAFAAWLWANGFPAGPSTGMALAQIYKMMQQGEEGNFVVLSPDNNFKYGDLIRDKLTELKGDILSRYPELDLGDIIDDYISHLEQKAGLDWILERVRQCYPVSVEGEVYGIEDIEDIVVGKIEIGRAAVAG